MMTIGDATAGMRGICCMVQMNSFEMVHIENCGNVRNLDRTGCRVIVQGGGRGSDMLVFDSEFGSTEGGSCDCFAMYSISDEWGDCNVLIPLVQHAPTLLLGTVLLQGFDCKELVTVDCAPHCHDNAVALLRSIILIPHNASRVLPVTRNMGLVMSAAAYNAACPSISLIISALQSSMVTSPRCCPAYALTTTLRSVLAGVNTTGWSVVLQDDLGCEMTIICSSLLVDLQAAQLFQLVDARVWCTLSMDRVSEAVQVESIYSSCSVGVRDFS